MLTAKSFFSILLLHFLAWPASILLLPVVQNTPVKVTDPRSGDVLQGLVLINGKTDVPGFRSTEVSFSYQNDPTATWFIIDQSTTPVKNDLIANWDTSNITDGEYQLRVRVELMDDQVAQVLVTNLRVRNYTPVETSTPDASAVNIVDPTKTSLPDFRLTGSTPIPLPTNPAQLTVENLQSSALRSVAFVIAAIVVAGVYWGIRNAIRRY